MNQIKVTPLQRANAVKALELWATVKPEQVARGLRVWRSDLDIDCEADEEPPEMGCGTAACFGGWLPNWQHFRDQGVRALAGGQPVKGDHFGVTVDFGYLAKDLFGWDELFLLRHALWQGPRANFTGTDHELVTARLNWLIENSEVVDA